MCVYTEGKINLNKGEEEREEAATSERRKKRFLT